MCMPNLPQAWRDGFDEVAELYDRVRPGYPDDLFDELAAALPRTPVVVEVGPGTGQATNGLVARGARVTAVELGAHLAAVLARNLPTVHVVIGPFENVDLAPGSFDAVVAASSYHWVPPEARMTRPAALLRPGGHLALIALNQVASATDRGFFDEVHHVFARHGLPGTHDPVPTHKELVPAFVDEIVASPEFAEPSIHRYHWDQHYTARSYTELKRTDSNSRAMADPEAREAMLAEVEALIDSRYDGWIVRPLTASLVLARRL
jgi:SAM-dependent methyltransferase